MNRNMILEAMYEIIKESTEWYVDSEDKKYCYFVDGVIAMTDKMLEKANAKEKTLAEALKDYANEKEKRITEVLDIGIV